MKAFPATLTASLVALSGLACKSATATAESVSEAPAPAVEPPPPVEPSAPAEAVVAAPAPTYAASIAGRYPKAGFELVEEDGRLWVFRSGSEELEDFRAQGELAKHITLLGAGPGGITMKAPEKEIILGYVAARPGFVTLIEDERIWVFSVGSEELENYRRQGEIAKQVIRPGAGPLGMTVKAADAETADAYSYYKEGFVVIPDDGRLWVFREGSPDLAEYHRVGEPAKHITRPGGGPNGKTIKAPEAEIVLEYMAACEGFETFLRDGRVWVFRIGDPSIDEFLEMGEPAKHVILPSAGPLSLTVKSPDRETIDAYLAQMGV